jgi:NifB/MoaA-like Fe-S oxidoreductase
MWEMIELSQDEYREMVHLLEDAMYQLSAASRLIPESDDQKHIAELTQRLRRWHNLNNSDYFPVGHED